jgi:hypothetical protein
LSSKYFPISFAPVFHCFLPQNCIYHSYYQFMLSCFYIFQLSLGY